MSRPSSSSSDYPTSQPPHKRARRSSSPDASSYPHPHRSTTNGKSLPPPLSQSSSQSLTPSPGSRDNLQLPPLSLSILGVEPLDEFIKEVADFVHHMIVRRPLDVQGKVEVEAKIGVLRDKHTNQRIALPILTETILAPDSLDVKFESNMSVRQHKHYNTLLNNLKTNSPSSSELNYAHLYLQDSFYSPNDHDRGEKIRVTRDAKTKSVVECVKKIRLGNLNIYSPKQFADWRVSVNLEVTTQHPLGSPVYTRQKDRLSYSHEEFTIDLTQVKSTTSPNSPPQTFHELELEITRSDFLLAAAMARGAPPPPTAAAEPGAMHAGSAFDELMRAFVNNARILVRNSDGGEGAWG